MAEIRIDLDATPTSEQVAFVESAVRNSFRISGFKWESDGVTITHEETDAADTMASMTRRFVFIAKNIDTDLVFHNDVPIRCSDDPQPELERRRDVIPIEPGFYSFQGDALRVLQALNSSVQKMAAEVDAIEQEHPAVWPVRLFKMIDYFREFPQQMILCAPVKDDFHSRTEFSKRFGKEAEFDSIPMDELMADATYGLQPAVCDCCYYTLEGARDLGNNYYSTVNRVFRNESSPTNQLDRLTNFTVRDIMFVGTEAFVLEARQKMIERLSDFLVSLGVNAKIETANDPFFANESAMKTVFQNAHRLKYELLAYIPHLDKEIATGSINLHTDFFGKAFDIQAVDGSVAHSGCIGVGMERMAYALFSQHGANLKDWPQPVLTFLNLDI
jgi:seryl-tRNA synthetase